MSKSTLQPPYPRKSRIVLPILYHLVIFTKEILKKARSIDFDDDISTEYFRCGCQIWILYFL